MLLRRRCLREFPEHRKLKITTHKNYSLQYLQGKGERRTLCPRYPLGPEGP